MNVAFQRWTIVCNLATYGACATSFIAGSPNCIEPAGSQESVVGSQVAASHVAGLCIHQVSQQIGCSILQK